MVKDSVPGLPFRGRRRPAGSGPHDESRSVPGNSPGRQGSVPPMCPKGVCPRSCPVTMASARSSLSFNARAMTRAIWLTSRVWVRPGAVMVSFGRQQHLGLVLEPRESLAVDDPVPIPLMASPQGARPFLVAASPGFGAFRGLGGQKGRLEGLPFLSWTGGVHKTPPKERAAFAGGPVSVSRPSSR
jgi:hypothetical protein